MDDQRLKRLEAVAQIAVEQERKTSLPATVMVAQWALESQWGSKPAGRANYFGIKRAARHEQFCTVMTHEVVHGKRVECALEFADYGSLEESCADYAWLITAGKPFRAAWLEFSESGDWKQLLMKIATVYATDPSYRRLALAIAEQQDVKAVISRIGKSSN